jgi:transcriptional regulator with XRE-family HTH domain
MAISPDPALAAAAATKIINDARWMAGLTQAEVAQRAGVTQQMIGLYETGKRQPSVGMLTRIVAGCGMELVLNLVPAAGPEDWATLDLLAMAPLDRLPPAAVTTLVAMAGVARDFEFLVGGKTAARFHGAAVRVYELELWVDEQVDLDLLEAYLRRAQVKYVSPSGSASGPVPNRDQLLRGWTLVAPGWELKVRCMSMFSVITRYAVPIALPKGGHLLVASTDDCSRDWRRRDLEHLALQRAVRLTPDKVSPWEHRR